MASTSKNTSTTSPHKRYTYFERALDLVIQRCARKWSYNEFKECFPLFVEDDPNGAFTKFTTIQDFIESQNMKDLQDTIMDQYALRDNLNVLDDVVHDAENRRRHPDEKKRLDIYRGNLSPQAALASRTVPILQREVDHLKAVLEQLDQETLSLSAELEKEIQARDEANAKVNQLCDSFETAGKLWSELPIDEYDAWVLDMRRTIPVVHRA
ncbi:hypothetical protein DL96DRAFT_1583382, partial [Flagelloscypha sp. PMI_526]